MGNNARPVYQNYANGLFDFHPEDSAPTRMPSPEAKGMHQPSKSLLKRASLTDPAELLKQVTEKSSSDPKFLEELFQQLSKLQNNNPSLQDESK